MRILELILHRSKRIGFSGLETIKYTPTADIQIIIGTNGSGKSSLMDELHPLPPNSEDMLAGGYKQIRIEHNAIIYLLKSVYNGKHHKHSFIQLGDSGDIELNEGGTSSAQKLLIESVFGINAEIMKIIIGRTLFTRMAPMKRRDWILKLSDNDLDYAMKLYQTIKNAHRDALALEKHHTRRLAEETSDITDKERIIELEKVVTTLSQSINEIMMNRESNVPNLTNTVFEMQTLLKEFEEISNTLLTVRLVKPHCLSRVDNNIHAVELELSSLTTRLSIYRDQLDNLYKDKEKVHDTIAAMESNGITEIAELGKVTTQISKELDKLKNKSKYFEVLQNRNISTLFGVFSGVKDILFDILSRLRDNSDGYLNNKDTQHYRDLLPKLEQKIGSCKEQVSKYQHQLEHFKSSTDVNCPKCNFGFKPGMVGFSPDTIMAKIDELVKTIEVDENRRKEAMEYLDKVREYRGEIKTLKLIMESNPDLKELWDILESEKLFKVPPMSHLPTINNFENDLKICIEIQDLEHRLKLNSTILESVKDISNLNEIGNGNYLNELDMKISNTINLIEKCSQDIAKVKHFMKEINNATKGLDRLNVIVNNLTEKYELMLKSVKNKVLNDLLQNKQVQLATTNNTLNQLSRHEAVIEELTKEKLKASEQVDTLATIMKTLSPVDGLISNYIQNFINIFIEDVNDLIALVWTTNLEILPCGVDSTDVTCKFPLSVMNGYLVTPDISVSSGGQADIINLMFRIAVVRYLGLEDIPLYLDELAPTLDEMHREKLTAFITSLMEDKVYNQMFMISHYSANHYAFPNSEIFMIDARNIVNKPKEFNRHVELTYNQDIAA